MNDIIIEGLSTVISLAVGGLIGYDDGTCQNPKCVNYTEEQNESKDQETKAGGES